MTDGDCNITGRETIKGSHYRTDRFHTELAVTVVGSSNEQSVYDIAISVNLQLGGMTPDRTESELLP